jgi:hypothetical protein
MAVQGAVAGWVALEVGWAVGSRGRPPLALRTWLRTCCCRAARPMRRPCPGCPSGRSWSLPPAAAALAVLEGSAAEGFSGKEKDRRTPGMHQDAAIRLCLQQPRVHTGGRLEAAAVGKQGSRSAAMSCPPG